MWITVLGKGLRRVISVHLGDPGSPEWRQGEKGSSALCNEFSRLGVSGIGKIPKTEMAGISKYRCPRHCF